MAGGARAGGNGVRAWEMAERESESEQVGERYAPLAELASGGEGHHRRGEGCWRGDAPPARACFADERRSFFHAEEDESRANRTGTHIMDGIAGNFSPPQPVEAALPLL